MSIRLVVFGLISLRGTEYVLRIFNHCFKGGMPCHVVIQNWVLRFGLYKLKQIPEKRNDWVYILDHTIEFGTKKCLVVLGIPLARFHELGCKIQHCDMEVLGISIVEKATAVSVTKVLRKISLLTGIPIQILSDKGSNIKKGISDFITEREEFYAIRQTYDVTHKAALILKKYLKNDTNWKSFVDSACKTKRSLVHTALAYLAPPKPRDKARWMNLDAYVDWSEKILCLKAVDVKKNERKKYKTHLKWVRKFRHNISEWRTILDMLDQLKKEVKSNGLNVNTQDNFTESVANFNLNTPRLIQIKQEIITYIEEECRNIDSVYPGCSDIIESVLGKYKIFSGKSPMKEVGKAVLTMPVFTSNIDYKEVKTAMESTSANDVKRWLDNNIGESLFSRRKKGFSLKKIKSSVMKNPEILKKAAGF
jgi:hypothetical protein